MNLLVIGKDAHNQLKQSNSEVHPADSRERDKESEREEDDQYALALNSFP